MEGYIAEIRMFAGDFPPRNWAYCNGQLVGIAQNQALFSLLGTTYGGDGQTTFGLPDLRSRVPMGTGTGQGLPTVSLGEMAGIENTMMIQTQMPMHSHGIQATVKIGDGADITTPNGTYLGSGATQMYATTAEGGQMAPNSVSAQTGVAGGGVPFSIMQPSIAMHYIICMYGIYPSRS